MVPNTRKLIVAATALATVVWLATPADAQRGGGGQGGGRSTQGGGGGGRSSGGGGPQGGAGRSAQGGGGRSQGGPQGAGPSRPAGPPQQAGPAPGYRQSGPPVSGPQQSAPPSQRYGSTPYGAPGRGQVSVAPGALGQSRGIVGARTPQANAAVGPQAQYRGYGNSGPGYAGGPGYGNSPQASHGYVAPRPGSNYSYGHGYGYAQPSHYYGYYGGHAYFAQPYYAFHSHFSIGFGIYVGYPIAYPYTYYDPYGFYNYGVGYGASYGVGVAPGYGTAYRTYSSGASYDQNQMGGVSFEIDPVDAAVFIDGQYVGVAADFSSGQMPLTVAAGRHHIDLKAQGFMTVSYDITVVAGQVIPYQGTMPIIR